VITTAGPIKPRNVQLLQLQRIDRLIPVDLYKFLANDLKIRFSKTTVQKTRARSTAAHQVLLRNITTPTTIRINGQKRSIL